MREQSTVPVPGAGPKARSPVRNDNSTITKSWQREGFRCAESRSRQVPSHHLLLAVVLGLGGTLWLHWIQLAGSADSMISHLPSIGIDAALSIPAAGLAIWLVATIGTFRSQLTRGISIGMALAVMYVPLSILSALGHLTLGTAPSQHHGETVTPGTLEGLLAYGVREALQVEPVLLMIAICGTALTGVSLSGLWRRGAGTPVAPDRCGRLGAHRGRRHPHLGRGHRSPGCRADRRRGGRRMRYRAVTDLQRRRHQRRHRRQPVRRPRPVRVHVRA